MNRISDGCRRTGATLLFAGHAWLYACAPAGAAPEPPTEQLGQSARVTGQREWFVTTLVPDEQRDVEEFGFDVALSGTTAIVGAPRARAVYVFVLAADGWHQQVRLSAPDEAIMFGRSVAISGNTLIVGAAPEFGGGTVPDTVYAYLRDGTTWGAPVPISANDGVAGDEFGASVAISGDTVVVGAPQATTGEDGYEGAAYVFTRSGASWTQAEKFHPATGFRPEFGRSVSLYGSTILVGAPFEVSSKGTAYFFTRSGTEWTDQRVELGVMQCCDLFGSSVAVGESIAVVGAPGFAPREYTPEDLYRQGAAFVYTKSGSSWIPHPDGLFADDPQHHDAFGTSVSVSGSTVMVGAPGAGGTLVGADTLYVYSPLTSSFVEARIGRRGDVPYLGDSVVLDGDVAAIGTIRGQTGAYVAELLVPDGGECDSGTDCENRHCVAGVCCNDECTGDCETCASGECTPLPDRPVLAACGPYRCSETDGECPEICASNADCADTHYCRNGDCVDRVPNGGECTEAYHCLSETCTDGTCSGTLDIGIGCERAADCESGFCVDEYCCNERCAGQCEACDIRGARGTCTPVEDGPPHGERTPCEGTGTECGGECDGEHTAACYYKTGTDCGSSCADDEQTDRACNGQGACEPSDPVPCEPYLCADDIECALSCERTQDCAAGFTCLDGICVAGSTCKDDRTQQNPDGTEEDCRLYRCEENRCRTTCERPGHCNNNTCVDGQCVPAPERTAASTNDSGGCSIAPPRSSRSWTLWVLPSS